MKQGISPEDGSYAKGGLGQALVASNFHFICGPDFWCGGLVEHAGNKALFLNLAASSARCLLVSDGIRNAA
jgi:hypothetical protein